MKNVVLVIVVGLVVLISSGRAFAESYKMENPSLMTVVGGDIPVAANMKVNITMLHLWSIGAKSPSTLYSYLSVPLNIYGTTISPGIGVANNYADQGGVAGILALSAFGKVGPFSHFSEVDAYFTNKVDIWATTRWLAQPIHGLPLNVGAQAYLFNTHLTGGPEISFSLPHVTVGVQALFGESSYSLRGVARSWF